MLPAFSVAALTLLFTLPTTGLLVEAVKTITRGLIWERKMQNQKYILSKRELANSLKEKKKTMMNSIGTWNWILYGACPLIHLTWSLAWTKRRTRAKLEQNVCPLKSQQPFSVTGVTQYWGEQQLSKGQSTGSAVFGEWVVSAGVHNGGIFAGLPLSHLCSSEASLISRDKNPTQTSLR